MFFQIAYNNNILLETVIAAWEVFRYEPIQKSIRNSLHVDADGPFLPGGYQMSGCESLAPMLIIEDNQADIELALYAFKKIQFANPIEISRDGIEVFQKIIEWETGSVKPVCILLDLKLPRVNGFEILTRLKAAYPAIPVIILTSSNEDSDIKKAYSLGANSYIVKPVELGKFIEIANQINLYWVVLNAGFAGKI